MQAGSPRVLIFGATSAIAAEVARLYAGRGARLYLVGRNPDKLAQVAAQVGAGAGAGVGGGPVVGTRAADLDDTAAADGLVAGGIAALGGLDVAIIAQGLLGDQLASERDFAEAERVIRTNFLSVVALLIPLANHLEAQGRGSIGVMSSVAGDRGRPRNFTYGAAKGALNVYLQGLRTRLGPRGVGVHTFKIGPVDTPMTVDHRKTAVFARAGDVAGGILATIDHGRGEAYLPWFWRPIMAVVRSMPEPALRRLPFLAGR
jgi:short-subunit dehydrogenase